MRILKYIIFVSILCGIFFAIYRQSDKKGLRRWWTSFKIAVSIGAILAGLIPVSPKAMETPGNNSQVYQEKLRSYEEDNDNKFEKNGQQVILVKRTNSGSGSSAPTPPGSGQPSQFPTPTPPPAS